MDENAGRKHGHSDPSIQQQVLEDKHECFSFRPFSERGLL